MEESPKDKASQENAIKREKKGRTKKMEEVEKAFNEPIDILLWRLYIEENKTLEEVKKELVQKKISIHISTLLGWLNKFNIPRREWGLFVPVKEISGEGVDSSSG